MSAPKRPSDDQDPDYVSSGPTDTKRQKIYEDTARANTANKIIGIVEKEFTKEIDDKEKEVLEIQNRLHKALKTLHLLRYVVVTDFYNRKQCQAQAQAVETKQTQIHPAIKRLIGKTPRRQKDTGLGDPIPSTSKNFQDILANDDKKGVQIEIEKRLGLVTDNLQDNDEKIIKVSVEKESEDPPKKIPRYIPPRSNIPVVTSPSRGIRHKVRERIVVGNISKWIPPDWREDGASHKWMMYVRGSKDAPDITNFISKVRFFLHPSYQPNDVVQIVSPPFHLSRRGWGEFPLRVQLHFKNVLNKPMDIIHHLKLDRTYTGLQTLGSETVVDIWIHTTTPRNLKLNLDAGSAGETNDEHRLKLENDDIDLSIIKKECSQGSDTLQEFRNSLQNSVKVEPIEGGNSADDISQLLTEKCIKIEHNYVSNNCDGEKECGTEIVHSMENNLTIRHSPPTSNNGRLKNKSTNSILKTAPSQKDNGTATSSENIQNVESNENLQDLEVPKASFTPSESRSAPMNEKNMELASNGQCESRASTCESVIEPESNQRVGGVKLLGKNVQSDGDGVSPIPIKLVKCNDKFFLMTDFGKLPSNQVDFVKIANSDVVKNILAKRIQPTKVSVSGNADNLGTKKIISVRTNAEMINLSNGQNGAEKEKSENSTARLELGIKSLETFSKGAGVAERSLATKEENLKLQYLDRNRILKKNSQQLEMQRLASSLKSIPSKSEPLKITIPPPFEPARKKQVLVLKNNKLISVDAVKNSSLTAALNSKQLPSGTILFDKNQEEKTDSSLVRKNKVSLNLITGMKTIEHGTSLLKPSVSILKKPNQANNAAKLEQKKSTATILKINPSSSLLLNSSSAVPALQIATPLHGMQNEMRNMILHNRGAGQMKLKKLPKSAKIDNLEDSKPVKVSVTLGKDKQKILSRRKAYEEVLRSIETVAINDAIGTLRYIMRRIPLITEDARDSDYKQMHPYSCSSQEEFFNYHLGKQRAHEWYRAKMARYLLKRKGFVNEQLWSVREILNWARVHGYTPVQTSLEIGNSNKTSKELPETNSTAISTCTESLRFNEWLENFKDSPDASDESDIEIDVVRVAETKIKTEIKTEGAELPESTITLDVDPSLRLPCAFVNETAREIGIRLQREEIIPGVADFTADRMIVKAVQCLADDIVRRSLARGWERNNNKCPDTILADDVRGALLSRDEFDVFTNNGLGSLQNMG